MAATDTELQEQLNSNMPGLVHMAELLLTVDEADRDWLSSAARIQHNMTGGRYTDALSSSIRAFKRGALTRESHEKFRAEVTEQANAQWLR